MYIHTYITDHFLASLHSNFDAQFLNLQILSGLPTCLSTLSGSFLSPSCRISLNMFKHMLFKIDRNSHICYRYLHMQFLVNDLSFFIDQTDKSLATSHIVRLFLWTGFHATHTVSRQKCMRLALPNSSKYPRAFGDVNGCEWHDVDYCVA